MIYHCIAEIASEVFSMNIEYTWIYCKYKPRTMCSIFVYWVISTPQTAPIAYQISSRDSVITSQKIFFRICYILLILAIAILKLILIVS